MGQKDSDPRLKKGVFSYTIRDVVALLIGDQTKKGNLPFGAQFDCMFEVNEDMRGDPLSITINWEEKSL